MSDCVSIVVVCSGACDVAIGDLNCLVRSSYVSHSYATKLKIGLQPDPRASRFGAGYARLIWVVARTVCLHMTASQLFVEFVLPRIVSQSSI